MVHLRNPECIYTLNTPQFELTPILSGDHRTVQRSLGAEPTATLISFQLLVVSSRSEELWALTEVQADERQHAAEARNSELLSVLTDEHHTSALGGVFASVFHSLHMLYGEYPADREA